MHPKSFVSNFWGAVHGGSIESKMHNRRLMRSH